MLEVISTVCIIVNGDFSLYIMYIPLRVQIVKAVEVQVMTNLPVDAIPIEMTVEESTCKQRERVDIQTHS